MLDEYMRGIFLESATGVAVLSSAPGVEGQDPSKRILNNAEMIGTRELIERLDGTGRLINHMVAHPNVRGEDGIDASVLYSTIGLELTTRRKMAIC